METPKKPKEEIKPVIEKIPGHLFKAIDEVMQKKRIFLNQFLQVSFQVVNTQKQQKDIADKLNNNEQSIGQKIQYAFKKMKLGKRKEYQWKFDGKGSFVGMLIPKPKDKKNSDKPTSPAPQKKSI